MSMSKQRKSNGRLSLKDTFLPNNRINSLKELINNTPSGKPRDILLACLKRKQGMTIEAISSAMRKPISTIRHWLLRIRERGLRGITDKKSTGRPTKFNSLALLKIRRGISKDPSEYGFESSSWSIRMAEKVVKNQNQKIKFSTRTLIRALKKLGFSYTKARPIPFKSASPAEQQKYQKNTKKEISEHKSRHNYKVFALDAVGIQRGSHSGRGWRLKGASNVIKTGFTTKSTQFYGALGKNSVYIKHTESLKPSAFIEFLKYLLEKEKYVIGILDNHSTHHSRDVKNFVESTKGHLILIYLPPHTPQLNPIEILWRELKKLIAEEYFHNSDELVKKIKAILKKKELKFVKIFGYMDP